MAFCFEAVSDNSACKKVGEIAKEVMIKRQNQQDVFKLLPLYEQYQEMVLDAYEVPMYNAMLHLKKSVNARNSIIKADELRKYDEVSEKRERSIQKFQLKYIKICVKYKGKLPKD